VLWNVYSESIALATTIPKPPGGTKATSNPEFNYFETIVAALKPIFSSGVKSLIVASPRKISTANDFMAHLQKHHAYFFKEGSSWGVHVSGMEGNASDQQNAIALAKSIAFKNTSAATIALETARIIELLDACIDGDGGDTEVFFTLDETDALFQYIRAKATVDGEELPPLPEYVLMTDTFYAANRSDPRLQRIMTIAKMVKVKTRVIQAVTDSGARITQLGGLVCFTSPRPPEEEDEDVRRDR
jgi:stalled ribosome rescue protein Dom34